MARPPQGGLAPGGAVLGGHLLEVAAVRAGGLALGLIQNKGWAVAVESLASSEYPAVIAVKNNVNAAEAFVRRGALATVGGAEELAKRAIRAGSATAR